MNVVVTGTGSVLPLEPHHVAARALLEASSRAARPASAEESAKPLVDGDFADLVPARVRRKMDRISKIGTAGVARVLHDAGLLPLAPHDADETGLVMDTALGSASTVAAVLADAMAEDPTISPLLFPNVVANAASGQAALCFGLRGPSSTLGGLGSIMYAFDLIRFGRARRLAVGGVDEIPELHRQAFIGRGLEDIVPGFGEGAAFVMLERSDDALRRGAPILAELVCASVTADERFELTGASAYAGGGWDRVMHEAESSIQGSTMLIGAGWPGTALRAQEEDWCRSTGAHGVWPKEATGEMLAASTALATVLAALILSERIALADRPDTVVVSASDPTRGQTASFVFHKPAATEVQR